MAVSSGNESQSPIALKRVYLFCEDPLESRVPVDCGFESQYDCADLDLQKNMSYHHDGIPPDLSGHGAILSPSPEAPTNFVIRSGDAYLQEEVANGEVTSVMPEHTTDVIREEGGACDEIFLNVSSNCVTDLDLDERGLSASIRTELPVKLSQSEVALDPAVVVNGEEKGGLLLIDEVANDHIQIGKECETVGEDISIAPNEEQNVPFIKKSDLGIAKKSAAKTPKSTAKVYGNGCEFELRKPDFHSASKSVVTFYDLSTSPPPMISMLKADGPADSVADKSVLADDVVVVARRAGKSAGVAKKSKVTATKKAAKVVALDESSAGVEKRGRRKTGKDDVVIAPPISLSSDLDNVKVLRGRKSRNNDDELHAIEEPKDAGANLDAEDSHPNPTKRTNRKISSSTEKIIEPLISETKSKRGRKPAVSAIAVVEEKEAPAPLKVARKSRKSVVEVAIEDKEAEAADVTIKEMANDDAAIQPDEPYLDDLQIKKSTRRSKKVIDEPPVYFEESTLQEKKLKSMKKPKVKSAPVFANDLTNQNLTDLPIAKSKRGIRTKPLDALIENNGDVGLKRSLRHYSVVEPEAKKQKF